MRVVVIGCGVRYGHSFWGPRPLGYPINPPRSFRLYKAPCFLFFYLGGATFSTLSLSITSLYVTADGGVARSRPESSVAFFFSLLLLRVKRGGGKSLYYPHLSTSVVVPVMTQEVKKKGKKRGRKEGETFCLLNRRRSDLEQDKRHSP